MPSADEFADRQAAGLSDDVQQGSFQGGLRLVMTGGEPVCPVQMERDLRRVLADQMRAQMGMENVGSPLGGDPGKGRPGRGLSPAGDAGLRDQLQDDRVDFGDIAGAM